MENRGQGLHDLSKHRQFGAVTKLCISSQGYHLCQLINYNAERTLNSLEYSQPFINIS